MNMVDEINSWLESKKLNDTLKGEKYDLRQIKTIVFVEMDSYPLFFESLSESVPDNVKVITVNSSTIKVPNFKGLLFF